MNKILLTGLILALAAAACDQIARDTDHALEAALDEISQESMYEHLAYLADDSLEGRESGAPGYDKAAAYVAEQYAEFGLE